MGHGQDRHDPADEREPWLWGAGLYSSTLEKTKAARARIDAHIAKGGQPIRLEVDGGIKPTTSPRWQRLVRYLVAGSAVFGAPDANGKSYNDIFAKFNRRWPSR